MNSQQILWDRDVTPKTKTDIYHAIVKSTITFNILFFLIFLRMQQKHDV